MVLGAGNSGRNTKWLVWTLAGLLLITAAFSLSAKTVSVGHTDQISSILNKAASGDTVLIDGGTYYETAIVIDKPIVLLGLNRPTIDAGNKGTIITITSPNVTVAGLQLKGAGVSFVDDNAGILVDGVSECIISDNILEDCFFGIYLSKVHNCSVVQNQVYGSASSESTSGNGIHLWYCRDVEIQNNRIKGHRDGIYFEYVKFSSIRNNESRQNLRYGLHFMFSDSCLYADNDFIDNGAGVAVMYTHGVSMTGNNFEHNWGSSSFGLLLKEITDSDISGNRFLENTIGIYLEGCNRVQIESNEFIRNGWGVKIMANSMDNVFTGNAFISNTFQVATNSRQNFSKFNGNYWSNYRGYDLDRDGVGDVPFRPVTLFSLVVEKNPPTLALLRSLLVKALDLAETAFPSLTPEALADSEPLMRRQP